MDDTLPAVGHLSPEWLDFFVVLGAIALVLLLAFFWALFLRKKGAQRRRKRRHRHKGFREQFQKNDGGTGKNLHERRRREHHPLNPTLAQTGGLPPIRTEEKPPDQTPPP
jgi:hypothetical protein